MRTSFDTQRHTSKIEVLISVSIKVIARPSSSIKVITRPSSRALVTVEVTANSGQIPSSYTGAELFFHNP